VVGKEVIMLSFESLYDRGVRLGGDNVITQNLYYGSGRL
jgi:hypothetical protein